MAATVVIAILAVGLVLVSLGAICAVLFMRSREQKRDLVLQSADALASLDDALDEAVKELNKLGLMVQKEIAEKYQAIQFLYNMVEEKEKLRGGTAAEALKVPAIPIEPEPFVSEDVPVADIPADIPIKELPFSQPTLEPEPPAPEKKKRGRPKKTDVAAKPAPRKRVTNPKHAKVLELHAQGLAVSDIAREMGIGQGEATLILEMASKRSAN